MLMLALHGSPRLWLVPAAAAAELLILRRRTTPSPCAARASRSRSSATVPACGVWTWSDAERAVAVLAESAGEELPLVPAAGAYALALASALLIGAPYVWAAAGPGRRERLIYPAAASIRGGRCSPGVERRRYGRGLRAWLGTARGPRL